MEITLKDLKGLFLDKLHNSSIVELRYEGNDFYIKIDATGMGLDNYFKGIDGLTFVIKCLDVSDLKFSYNGYLDVIDFNIESKGDILLININDDISFSCHNYEIKNIDKLSKNNK